MCRRSSWLYVVLFMSLFLFSCGDDSGDGNTPVEFSFEIENTYDSYLSDQQQDDIYQKLSRYNLLYQRATVLVNSALFADMQFTSPDVVKYRAQKAEKVMSELSDLAYEIALFEAQTIEPVVNTLGGDAKLKSKSSGDFYHAWKLIDLYMNDDVFYKKYKLSDISRRTQVSVTRLRMMMAQVANEIEVMGYDQEAELYADGVRNMKAIRDTAVAAEGALVTFASGGATAGTMGTFAKGVVIVEKANAIISCTEAGVGLINASMGTDDVPPTIQKVFTGNKVLSYVLLPKGLAGKDIGSVIALGGPVDDLTDYYFNVSTDNSVKVTDTPQNSTTRPIQEQSLEKTVNDMLLPGAYKIPHSELNSPDITNSGFEFDDDIDLTSMDALKLEAAKLEDLWDLPTATSDNYSWDTEKQNPDTKFINLSSIGFPDGHPLQEDEVLTDGDLRSNPVVSLVVDNKAGEVPFHVTFTVNASEKLSGVLTYTYHHGDGGYEEGNLATTTHTYTEAGTYTAIAYVKHPTLGSFASNTISITVTKAATVIPDGDDDSDQDSVHSCSGLCSQSYDASYCLNVGQLCYCGDDYMWQSSDCDSLCLAYGFGLPSQCGVDDYGSQTCFCGDAIDGDADDDTEPAPDTWVDTATGYMWQVKRPDGEYNQFEAANYCDNLTLGGYGDWRLPDLDSYKTFIRGCPVSMPGGTCGYSNNCHDYNACIEGGNDCTGCGCGEGQCYWDQSVIKDTCYYDGLYWTSTKWEVTYYDDTTGYQGFSIGFCFASVDVSYSQSDTFHVRCMRGGQ